MKPPKGKAKDKDPPASKPTSIPPDRLSDEPGAYSGHQEDVAGEERRTGVPHETPRDDRASRKGFRTGND
jgi:hypothetical protein